MTVGVAMALYNGARFIRKQLDTIRLQTLQPDRVVMCDDGSKDGTTEIVAEYIKEYGLGDTWELIKNEENLGYAKNFYKAMSLCNTDLIFLADQDDVWELDKIEKAEIDVMDVQSKETEVINFERKDGLLIASVPTKEVQTSMHWDVALLIVLFALTMMLSQKAMMAMNKNTQQDPAQAAMQKSMNTFMPIMLTFTFVIIPIPAGVLLYLIASNCFQVLQTVIINKQLEAEDAKKTSKIDDDDVANAKRIQEK